MQSIACVFVSKEPLIRTVFRFLFREASEKEVKKRAVEMVLE